MYLQAELQLTSVRQVHMNGPEAASTAPLSTYTITDLRCFCIHGLSRCLATSAYAHLDGNAVDLVLLWLTGKCALLRTTHS